MVSHFPQDRLIYKAAFRKVLSNVVLLKGWFDQTLPEFLRAHPEMFSFVHLDADTYSSTEMVLRLIGDHLASGTILVFDEYLGYPGWQNGEFKAWQEFTARHGIKYEYLAFSNRQAAVRIA